MMDTSINKVLGEAKAIDILLALLDGPKHIRQLHREVGGSTATIEVRANELIKVGLIKEAKQSTPGKRILELTDYGIIIAKILKVAMRFSSPNKINTDLNNQIQVNDVKQNSKIEPKSTNIDLKSPKKWILILLYALGPIKGSTRLEKLLFLLKEKFKIINEPFYEFKPHLFGPFSADVLNDAWGLQKEGLIEIKLEIFEMHPFSDWIIARRTYIITEKGREIIKPIYEEITRESKIKEILLELQLYNYMPLNVLLEYIYRNYPEFTREETELKL